MKVLRFRGFSRQLDALYEETEQHWPEFSTSVEIFVEILPIRT